MNGERDLVVGGGIAGIAAAVALSEAGREVCLLEKRAFLGGRASSFVDKETGEEIDNCQHVVLGCCTNVLDLFEKLGVRDQIEFSREFHYIEPDGRRHHLGPVNLPAPLHFLPGILSFGALSRGERFAIVCAFLRMMWTSDRGLRSLADCTVAEWLSRQRQPERAIRRFWDPILVSAVNESLDRAAALPCLQVFLEGFLPHRRAAAMGIPRIGLQSALRRAGEAIPRGARLHRAHAGQGQPHRAGRKSRPAASRSRTVRLSPRIASSSPCRSKRQHRFRSVETDASSRTRFSRASSTRRSPAFTCGTTARFSTCRTRSCSTAPCNGSFASPSTPTRETDWGLDNDSSSSSPPPPTFATGDDPRSSNSPPPSSPAPFPPRATRASWKSVVVKENRADLLLDSGLRGPAPRQPDGLRGSLPRRRLDRERLAGHAGRLDSERKAGGGRRHGIERTRARPRPPSLTDRQTGHAPGPAPLARRQPPFQLAKPNRSPSASSAQASQFPHLQDPKPPFSSPPSRERPQAPMRINHLSQTQTNFHPRLA